ncbi:hypothetical protein MRS44_009746 [Fusarium solani]|uniref:Major facilitator superfamily domain-containing protein n=1 Tax=Fusarium solani TaxID=169388 RepID=A0A9P9HLQ1_FUSSL|nr:major facilitator superfamily domain-containing protein [Fusarium solani]KAH7258744.1 major facilitator superfamily domain-containing protein [Fusarium solani]KAJ3461193.1 hypothetical protein MRS44_009746 [Fusarium solani]KAJ4206456.1 hypothetical protein NW759_014242 [Fusarium solani]
MSTTQTQPVEAYELTAEEQEETEPESDRLDKGAYLRIFTACFSFFVAGINDGSLGALIPYMIRDYQITTAIVSIIYGATFLGWVFAAVTNTHLCQFLGLGSMLALGAVSQLIGHVLRTWKPPFPLMVVTFWFTAIGQAFNDTHANTFVAKTKGAYRWLAIIHASYMGGCLVGPFVATGIASRQTSKWYFFYLFAVGVSAVNILLVCWAFRDTLVISQKTQSEAPSRNKDALQLIKSTLGHRSVWLLSMFYFFYVGSQITINGWVVEYLVQVRDGNLAQMGFIPAAFNGGCLIGRLVLAEPTYQFGERRMVFFYCVVAIGLQLVFWLVPNIIAAAVAVSFLGFVTGPLFATGISLGTKLFPHENHATALGYVFVFAQMGGAFFPIVTGVVASRVGVKVLQPFLVGILSGVTISWLLIPQPKSLPSATLHQE